jgi:succinylglutamate desuccinylase
MVKSTRQGYFLRDKTLSMNLESELKLFSKFASLESPYCEISLVGPSIYHLKTKSLIKSKATLGFLALVHGNEYLGLPILNSLLKSIFEGTLHLNSDIYFGLGNVPAAFAKKRFIEEDLNRCFGKNSADTGESRRARELEAFMLDHCDYLIDIHQTISCANEPFFIFQYSSERCLSVIQKWNPGISTVLQRNQMGENTGLCADEYIRSKGSFGTALELGQLGTDEHFELGFKICKTAVETISEDLSQRPFKFPILDLHDSFKVKNSSYKLDEGWKNLKPFRKGERLGVCNEGIIEAPTTGYILFPRYRTVEKGEDLFHYCTTFIPSSDVRITPIKNRVLQTSPS